MTSGAAEALWFYKSKTQYISTGTNEGEPEKGQATLAPHEVVYGYDI